jgi:NADH-quinone oxidoreductase subunit M
MLYLLLIAPAASALLACFAGGKDSDATYRLGLFLTFAIALLGLPLVVPGMLHAGALAPVSITWFTLWGTGAHIHLSLESDGLSGWLIQLVTWITPLALLGCRKQIGAGMREFLVCILIMEALMIGALLSRDLVVFYLCYEGMLIPMVVIIVLFGGIERRTAAMWFFLYTMACSIFLLVAIWYIAWILHTTDVREVIDGLPYAVSGRTPTLLFWAFVLAFAVKVPLPPLHGWQPKAYTEAPGAGVALLAGAMSKIGIYGFLRFVLPIFPAQCVAHQELFIVLGLIATLGGAMVAIAQTEAKSMLAYSSLSHLGLVMIGIFTFTPSGLNGAAVQMVAHGFSVAALFMLVGYLESRTHSTSLDGYGNLVEKTPVLATLFVLAALASCALPGTLNFIGEFQLLLGAFKGAGFWVATLAGIPVILVVVYMLILIQRWFYGKPSSHEGHAISDLTAPEGLAVAVLLVLSFGFGFYPMPISSQAGAIAENLGQPAAAKAAALGRFPGVTATAIADPVPPPLTTTP